MADTNQQQQLQQEAPEPPQTNGVIDGLTEEEKFKMRPADIDADMREMERRKRVEMMMNSRLFREELERIIETQMKDGSGPSGLLQQISEMMGPQGVRFNTNVFRNSNCVVPINDIRGVESMGYAKGEKLLRCKLAAVFRLLDLYGWTQGVGGMITARLNQDQEHFLVNPYGLLYHEVTASSLVKADMQGGVVEQGTTNFGVHIASYQLHSTIHAARPDIKCIVHIATPSVTAISATKCGLLPLGQESIVIGEVNTHHYISGSGIDPEEREKLARNIGPVDKVMLLANRGALCCGETVEEAFYNVYNTVLACETQLKLMPLGVDNLTLVTDEARKAIYEASRKAPIPQPSSVAENAQLAEKLEKRWRIGGTEFEALMRMLDNAGFRTGYIYRHPLVKSEPPRPRNDVEVPPAVSSLGYLLEEEELYKQGLWKGGRKGTDRTRWLNSPNVYQKVEILETGTPDPKKITKWVSDGSPTHNSTAMKIDGALQFVPKNTNPKEFKQLQQQIKDYRRADKISAGPQSHILEGVTWEEAKKMQDATISGTGEQVVLVGAASKGIIQRGFQHNAMVYKTPYAKNPFDAVTDQELDQYKREIERKAKGDIYDESQSESEALSSFNISRATHESSTAKSPIQSPVSVTSETEEESRDEPKVLRIETKQVPVPSQPEVVLSDGLSGVSRLSSSRSNSSSEDFWPWQNYNACHLETVRSLEFAQPMKAIITDVQRASRLKRKTKLDFFKNYEKKFKNNICMEENIKSDSTSKLEIIHKKVSQWDEGNRKPSARRQLKAELDTEISYINFGKNADIDYAEKVDLPMNYSMDASNINSINSQCKEDSSCSTTAITEANIKINNSTENEELVNEHASTECSLNTLEVFSDNELDTNINIEVDINNKLTAKFGEDVNDNRNAAIYVNEVQISVGDYPDKTDCNYLEINSMNMESGDNQFECDNISEIKLENNNNEKSIANIVQSKNYVNNLNDINNQNEDLVNYVNEVEFFVCNNSCTDKDVIENSDLKDPLDISVVQKEETDVCDIKNKKIDAQIIHDGDLLPTHNKSSVENVCASDHLMISNNEPPKNNPSDDSLRNLPENENINENVDKCNVIVIDNEKLPKVKSGKMDSAKSVKSWSSISSNCTRFIDDGVVSSNKCSNTSLSNLDFTYSDIEKNSGEEFSLSSTCKESIFSNDESMVKPVIRCDSLTDVIDSINDKLQPSNNLVVNNLANTENSEKYNLDSQKMSIIYSLTPPNDISDTSRNTTIAESIFEDDDYYEDFDNDDDNKNASWANTSKETDIKDRINKTIEISESSFISNASNQGSDILELSSHTFLDLQKSSEENFHKTMSSSVNQIITELDEAEVLVTAANFVDELCDEVMCITIPPDVTKYSKLELSKFVQEKVQTIKYSKKLAKDLVASSPRCGVASSTHSKVSNNEETSHAEQLDQGVYVISELVYHVIDKDSLGKWDFKTKKTVTEKKDKESMNIELKGLKDDYDTIDEQSLKSSTPKFSLSPNRSRNNSFSLDQAVTNVDNEDIDLKVITVNTGANSKSSQNSDTAISTNSPSTESQNFAEQEVTSESTDNDTKSDNSKEKQTEICETAIIKSVFLADQINNNGSLDSSGAIHSQSDKRKQLQYPINQVNFCLIEFSDENCFDSNSEYQESLENRTDNDNDSDESLEFMRRFMDDANKIEHIWQLREAKLEESYATERLREIEGIKQNIIDCQEIIHELDEFPEENTTFSSITIEELESSMINDNCDNKIKTIPKQCKITDEGMHSFCSGYDSVENNIRECLTPILEENELEYVEYKDSKENQLASIKAIDTCESFTPVIEIYESNSFSDVNLEDTSDSKTLEFHSCHNSSSTKSFNDQELINSTYTFSTEESLNEKNYSTDASVPNDNASLASTMTFRSESIASEEVKENSSSASDIFTDTSNSGSLNNNNEAVVLECMTCSYDTNEFIKLERDCKNSSDESNYACCEISKLPNNFASFPKYEETEIYKFAAVVKLSDSLSTTSYESSSIS